MPVMTEPRRFPPPWDIEEHNRSRYIVRDGNGQALAYVYFEAEPGRRTAAGLLTRDEARRFVAPGMADGQSWPSFCGSISAVRS